jgi:hypothetical protein
MSKTETIYFPENDTHVTTVEMEPGRWKAYFSDGSYDEHDIRGYGDTQLASIADLNRALAEVE